MKILAIETSCDETALALVQVELSNSHIEATTLNKEIFSQIDIHKEFGGVFPAIAKREHARYAPILLEKMLKEIFKNDEIPHQVRDDSGLIWLELSTLLEREPGLFDALKTILQTYPKPDIDALAVTQGPGLEPALWVGINFAKALSLYWDIPLIPTNHMKGHIFSVLLNQQQIEFPALALLISGGHTELVAMKSISEFEVIGKTRDDAIGESYDKVARLLGFEYPGGPKIAQLADNARSQNIISDFSFPRPMIHSSDLDFSFSGLKTAILYKTKEFGFLTDDIKLHIAHDFEQAVVDIILKKITKALDTHHFKTLLVSGGVIANSYIRLNLQTLADSRGIPVLFPTQDDSTDNAQMIAVAAAIETQKTLPVVNPEIKADGNLMY